MPHTRMAARSEALPGRQQPALTAPGLHAVLDTPLTGPWPDVTAVLSLALWCFWGAEKALWQLDGVVTTAVGYQGGSSLNPTYDDVCTGITWHA